MSDLSNIKEHMEVIGADGVRVGTVDKVEDGRIKLTKDSATPSHQGHHHFIAGGLVLRRRGIRPLFCDCRREPVLTNLGARWMKGVTPRCTD